MRTSPSEASILEHDLGEFDQREAKGLNMLPYLNVVVDITTREAIKEDL